MTDTTPGGQQPFSLPPLSQMTQGIAHRDDPQSNKQSPNEDVRDSGNWSMPSKRESHDCANPRTLRHLC